MILKRIHLLKIKTRIKSYHFESYDLSFPLFSTRIFMNFIRTPSMQDAIKGWNTNTFILPPFLFIALRVIENHDISSSSKWERPATRNRWKYSGDVYL